MLLYSAQHVAEQSRTVPQCHPQAPAGIEITDEALFHVGMSLGSFQCNVLQLTKMPSGTTAVAIPWHPFHILFCHCELKIWQESWHISRHDAIKLPLAHKLADMPTNKTGPPLAVSVPDATFRRHCDAVCRQCCGIS